MVIFYKLENGNCDSSERIDYALRNMCTINGLMSHEHCMTTNENGESLVGKKIGTNYICVYISLNTIL